MYTEDQLKIIVKTCISYKDLLFKLNMNYSGGNYMKLRKSIKKWNIDISHFLSRSEIIKNAQNNKKIPIKEILIENSTYSNGNNLKDKLYKLEIKQPQCEECGMGEWWNNKKLKHHLDHINGNRYDNRIENLRILCPNCHSQTSTYTGKNRSKKKLKIKKKQIKKLVDSLKYKEEKENKINKILNSNIDFSKWGWPIELSKYMNHTPQWTLKWVKENMSEFYKEKCKH